MKTFVAGIAGLVFVIHLFASHAAATNQAEAQEIARLLAILLSSGRVVLAHNQALIDDPEKGEKGFTSAVFETQVVEEFKKRSGGIDLAHLEAAHIPTMGKTLLKALLVAGMEVIDGKQVIINEKFFGYKNVIPATWGTWTSEKFSQRNRVLLKQTALDFRNPNNAPDEFETRILQRFALPDYPRNAEWILSEVTNNGKTLRLMLPLYHKKECLVCHGIPKGEIDISGYRKEGHEEGGPAGAISVAIPLEGH